MRIKLEYEDGPVFSTLTLPMLGDCRVLMVRINGKPFTVWRTLRMSGLARNDHYIQQIDELLIDTLQRMFEKLFLNACAAVTEGADLMAGDE